MRRVVIILVLICATTHCVLSIYHANTSYLDLHRYAQGKDRQPFQGRLLMVPVLRWAESSRLLQTAATRFGEKVPQHEPMSAAKLVCIVLSLLLLNAAGLWTLRISKNLSIRHKWLVWALVLAILYASYGARYEQPLWYPYDIPHLVLFGVGTILILCDEPMPFVVVFVLDAFMRETSVFLLPLALLVHFRSRPWRAAVVIGSFVWGFSRLLAYKLYPNGPYAWNGLHWYTQLKPWHLPQLLSIGGFLLLPVWLGSKWLNRSERLALYAATSMIAFTFFFATWNETRAWLEWTVLIAILAAVELERSFASPRKIRGLRRRRIRVSRGVRQRLPHPSHQHL